MSGKTGRRNSIKDSVKKLFGRPKERPLAIVKGKASFAPQLPNLSRLSLIPDFATSIYDLKEFLTEGEEFSNLHLQSQTRPSPQSIPPLLIRYSLYGTLLSDVSTPQPEIQAQPKPLSPQLQSSLRRVPTPRRAQSSFQRAPTLQRAQSSFQRAPTLRRVQAHESLSNASKSALSLADVESDSSVTLISDKDDDDFRINTGISVPEPDEFLQFSQVTEPEFQPRYCANAFSFKERVKQRVMKKLSTRSPDLMKSFCIIDLQLPGHPVRVTSADLLSQCNLEEDELLFVDNKTMDNPFVVKTSDEAEGKIHYLSVQGDLYTGVGGSPTHRFVGLIELTDFVIQARRKSSSLGLNPDIWLELAHEEMEKNGIRPRTRYQRQQQQEEAEHPPLPAEMEIAEELIKSIHSDYFVIRPVDQSMVEYEITHTAPNLLQCQTSDNNKIGSGGRPQVVNLEALRESLVKGKSFMANMSRGADGLFETLYCLAMFGPGLNSWLCFLVDGSLPPVWAK